MKEKFKRTTLGNISKLPYKLICSNALKVTTNFKRLASKTWATPDFCTVLKYDYMYMYVICNNYIKI